jgi:hypothetical protein
VFTITTPLQMSANNADARHNVAGYVVHSQGIVTQSDALCFVL